MLLLLLLWALDTEVQKRVSLMGFGSHPRGVEPPSTRQLELQPAWDKGGILRPVQSQHHITAIYDHHSLRDCKTVTYQSWRSEKNALLVARLLSKRGFEWVQSRIFFGPPTLTGQSFAAFLPMIMHGSSFESTNPYLFVLNLKNSIASIRMF